MQARIFSGPEAAVLDRSSARDAACGSGRLCAAHELFGTGDAASRHAIAAAELALIESRVGRSHQPLRQIAGGAGDAIERADPETRRDRELTELIWERLRADTLA